MGHCGGDLGCLMAEVGGFGFQLAKIVGFGFSVSAVKFFQFGSRDDGEVADLFGDGDEDMVVMLYSEEERQERCINYRNY